MTEPNSRRKIDRDNQVLISLALVTVLIHLLCSSGYGYFRDELYAIACSKHLAWGYVDQPPFSEFVLALIGHLLGYSLFALRLLPAVCGGLVAFLVGLIARRIGWRAICAGAGRDGVHRRRAFISPSPIITR